jgi:hypothetical protein
MKKYTTEIIELNMELTKTYPKHFHPLVGDGINKRSFTFHSSIIIETFFLSVYNIILDEIW